MAPYWSGAIVYEWIEEANDYGLISYGSKTNSDNPTALDGYPRSGTPSPVSPDYSNLKKQWATLSPTGTALSDYSASAKNLKPIACPTSTSGGWIVDAAQTLPSLGQTLDKAATSTGGLGGSAGGKGAGASATKKAEAGKPGYHVVEGGMFVWLWTVFIAGVGGLLIWL